MDWTPPFITVNGFFLASFYAAGLVCAVYALWRSRTPQGAAAWIVGLLSFPFVTVPFFLVFGRNRFFGYVRKRKELDAKARAELEEARRAFTSLTTTSKELLPLAHVSQVTNQPEFTQKNAVELLINGQATYDSMLDEIKKAKTYICVQFYIFRVDEIGHRIIKALIEQAERGVQIFFMYDAIGSTIARKDLKIFKDAGVIVHRFESTKRWNYHLQINFRNHRKILVIDGNAAFVGGLNIGDDYLGKWKDIGPWRDTHVKLEGPAALAAQIAFAKDWFWATGEMPNLDWHPKKVEQDAKVFVFHTGPADPEEACLLSLMTLFGSAQKRIWIANPYFLPPEGLLNTLLLASFRGVDVRILIPEKSDNRWVDYASEVFQERLIQGGVKIFKYHQGFLHQKVFLIDDDIASVGSLNLDSRSIFINFEINAIVMDAPFAKQVDAMLTKDFLDAHPVTAETLKKRSFARQCLARASCLMSPML